MEGKILILTFQFIATQLHEGTLCADQQTRWRDNKEELPSLSYRSTIGFSITRFVKITGEYNEGNQSEL